MYTASSDNCLIARDLRPLDNPVRQTRIHHVMRSDLESARRLLFDETYRMWKADLTKIFRIGTRGTKGGCNLSSCILVLIGIESFSKFFSNKSPGSAFAEFFDKYYPPYYHGKMLKVYELFRHGLAHNFYPKSEFRLTNASRIALGVDEQGRVPPLSRIGRNLDAIRTRVLNLSPPAGKPYVLAPQVLFLDTVDVMESLRKGLRTDTALQSVLVSNHNRVRQILGHTP